MTPRISDRPFYRLTIPDLSGGVNYRDGISLIHDNQLSDARNVWYKDGILRTRPGVRCVTPDELIEQYTKAAGKQMTAGRVYAYPKIIWMGNGIPYRLVVTVSHLGISFHWFADAEHWFEEATIGADEYPADQDPHINVVQFKDNLYCFLSGYYPDDETAPYFIFRLEFDEQSGHWRSQRIYDRQGFGDEMYVPIIATNCKPFAGDVAAEDAQINGDFFEGYNLLGNSYKLIYSTGAPDKDAPMTYVLANDLSDMTKFAGEHISAEFTSIDGIRHVHGVNISGLGGEEWETHSDDGLYMHVCGRLLWFSTEAEEGASSATISKDDYLLNNMVITAPCLNTEKNIRKVMDMTFSEWFGGGAQGIYGGLHLFMGGNTNDGEKSLVIWSDFNKPLYFSENAYAYVGNTSQKVTAFGKQGEALIIFKEQETYATQYTSIDDVMSATSVMNQAIVDVAASEVTFPMIQVHGSIGCDCPGTVQLCRNRLVWAHSSGKVYTLISANQWNERSIFELSTMVERLLKKDTLAVARSADWDGHYVLATCEHVFVMDYNTYGYTHVASYTKEEDAQSLIPWWVWETPTECPAPDAMMVLNGDQLAFWSMLTVEHPDGSRIFWPEIMIFGDAGDIVPYVGQAHGRAVLNRSVASVARTKLFDFGSPTTKKAVPKAEICFGANGGTPIIVKTITDQGEDQSEITVDGDETNDRQPRFFTDVVVRNGVRNGNRIGYQFECDGNLYLDALSIHYKHLGGAK